MLDALYVPPGKVMGATELKFCFVAVACSTQKDTRQHLRELYGSFLLGHTSTLDCDAPRQVNRQSSALSKHPSYTHKYSSAL